MDIPIPALAVGDRLKVWFPVEDEETTVKRKATTVAIKRCKKIKHESWYQYTLQFDDGEEQTTRLLHLKYKISKKTKKRSAEDEVTDGSIVNKKQRFWLPSHQRILAPMVGGSELAFRLLCRRYGCDLAYTPMINSQVFSSFPYYQPLLFLPPRSIGSTDTHSPLFALLSPTSSSLILLSI